MFNKELISNLTQGHESTPMNAGRKAVVESLNSVHSCCSKRYCSSSFWKLEYGSIGLMSGMSAIADSSRVWTR